MKAVRRPQFWYNFIMWILSIVISALLIQIGGLIMSDVPTAGTRIERNDFINTAQLDATQDKIHALEKVQTLQSNAIEDAQFVLRSRRLDYKTQRASFDNWIKTRTATQANTQNAEVIKRANAIELLKNKERKAEQTIEDLQQASVKTDREFQELRAQRSQIINDAYAPYEQALKFEALKVFGLRLALTLPLLLISGWLIFKKRKSSYWPVYRGFIIFSLFAFFIELLPYLPSYGGYVRYSVGIILALLFARFSTKAMARYLQNKQNEENKPEKEKRKRIEYEAAVKKISGGVCPSCDRQFNANAPRNNKKPHEDSNVDFCVHCGFCLYNNCDNCGERENSFYKFCGACGVPSQHAAAQGAI